ncbi:MAG: hypothetical protein QG593_357 [Patescibacteria group bacterium]|nr:hypothetical protein [Patescibacteria group bacterium]
MITLNVRLSIAYNLLYGFDQFGREDKWGWA